MIDKSTPKGISQSKSKGTPRTVKPKTLKQQIRWQLMLLAIAFGLAIVVSVSFITWRSVIYAADSVLKMEALLLEKKLDANPSMSLPRDIYFQAYRRKVDIPEHLLEPFIGIELADNQVYEQVILGAQGESQYVSLMRHVKQDGQAFYVLSLYDSKETDALIEGILRYMLNDAVWLLLFIYFVLFSLIFWLLKRTNEPMVLLSQWATKLKDNDRLVREEFSIQELNELAEQLRAGVDRITEFNLREQQFLKHASHEMRTPLATIQACLDTLDYQLDGPESKTVKRALKASHNMRRLSQALLWLARESEKEIEREDISLQDFVSQLVDEHQYLLQNRPVTIRTDISDCRCELEAELLHIVMANLLRNACQYTQEGEVEIVMDKHSLSIRNPSERGADVISEYQSFGLGLQLVERICSKVGWQFSFVESDNKVEVSVSGY